MVSNYLNIELFGQGFTEPFALAPNAKTRIRALAKFRQKSGIYLIKEDNQIVYVGMSKSCVLKACYRHFEYWEDWRTKHVTYRECMSLHHYSILILPISLQQVDGFEHALIATLKPRDNKNKLELIQVQEDEVPF